MYAAVRRSRTLAGAAGLSRRCHDGRPPLRVTLIEGQGPGPTVCAAVRKVVRAAGVRADWDRRSLNEHRDPFTGRAAVNADVLRSAADTGLVLRGPGAGSAQDGSHGSAALTLHKALGASVGVKLFASVDGHHPFGRVRIVNVRDNVSGEYSEIEHTVVPGVVQSIKTVKRSHSEAVARFAFDYAAAHGHGRVTALHKAGVMRLSDGLFLRACRCVSAARPDVEYGEEKLDKFCLHVTQDPGRYDVLLTPSLYGSLAAGACAALAGGVATVPTAAYGPRVAVFGTMGDNVAAGQCELVSGRHADANPTGLIRAAVWMLCHAGVADAAARLDAALHAAIRQGVRTRDMGGDASCAQFADAVVCNMSPPPPTVDERGRPCP